MGKVLIDGDILAYRAAYSTQDKSTLDAIIKVDELTSYVINKTTGFIDQDLQGFYQVYLTGSGNFRYDIAKTLPYKGNRKSTERPKHLTTTRDRLVDNWGAIVSEGEEADDLIGIAATSLGENTIVASIDKDMLQIPCRHYNFNKNTWETVDNISGLQFFYKQILTGDRADNIGGLRGIGEVKADKIISPLDNEEDMWDAVVEMYNGDEEHVIENARLLWLRRYEDQLWLPPTQRNG